MRLPIPREFMADENYEIESVRTHSRIFQSISWQTFIIKDRFDDSEVGWVASTFQEERRSLHLYCSKDQELELRALTAEFSIRKLRDMRPLEEPIRAKIRVDENYTVDTKGKYPSTLSTDFKEICIITERMKSGKEVRIRTEHDYREHTFVFNLSGFKEASDRILSICGVKI